MPDHNMMTNNESLASLYEEFATFHVWRWLTNNIIKHEDNTAELLILCGIPTLLLSPITLSIDITLAGFLLMIATIVKIHTVETAHTYSAWKKTQGTPLQNTLAEIFAPLTRLRKNITDTIKPYKYNTATEFFKITKQPIEGFAYIVSGLYRVITTPIVGILYAGALLLNLLIQPNNNISNQLSSVMTNTINRTLNGIIRIIAGAAQIALTPFTWLVKPIIRSIITTNSAPQLIENNTGIKARLKTATTATNTDEKMQSYTDIHRKLQKCSLIRGQATKIDLDLEESLYEKLLENNDEGSANEHAYHNLVSQRSLYAPNPRVIQPQEGEPGAYQFMPNV